MKNKIIIQTPIIKENQLVCKYTVEGEWKKAFSSKREFVAEYNIDISDVPAGIAVVPLLANILPMAWVYDAEIDLPVCDEDFYKSIPEFKKGYEEMYPMMDLKGNIQVEQIQKNVLQRAKESGAFFSGGVDAFNTLVCHEKEKPVLLTVWGADVKLDDEMGWKNVFSHLKETAKEFHTEYVTIKSNFRMIQKEDELTRVVEKSGDGWWHGFQHGIGIICHAAPVAYKMGLSKVYFASSFTAADKGKVTCASDPTIDNYVRFCGTKIVHDGYEFNRQMKVHNITEFAKKTGKKIPLRVCWESTGGSNCCNCEKCWRTILAIYAERQDPRNYGFNYSDFGRLCSKIYGNRKKLKHHRESRYEPIQKLLRENYTLDNIEPNLKWFYKIRIDKLGEMPVWYRGCHFVYRRIKNVLKKKL